MIAIAMVIGALVCAGGIAAVVEPWRRRGWLFAPPQPSPLSEYYSETPEPAENDPLDEEFRKLEDDVLRRDDPEAWKRRHQRFIVPGSALADGMRQSLSPFTQNMGQYMAAYEQQRNEGLARRGLLGSALHNDAIAGLFGGLNRPRQQ